MVAPLPVDIPSKRMETKPSTLVANGSVWGKPVLTNVDGHVASGGIDGSDDTDDNDSCTQSSAVWRPKAARNNASASDTLTSNGKLMVATNDNEYPTAAEASKVDTKCKYSKGNPFGYTTDAWYKNKNRMRSNMLT